jgi:hypothetical protein
MRRGVALVAVLLALALVNALVVGAVFVSRRQAASARVDGLAAPLQPLAERSLVMAISAWDSLARSEQLVATTATQEDSASGVTIWITRTGADTYWLVSESRLQQPPGLGCAQDCHGALAQLRFTRRIGVVVRLEGGWPRVAFPRAWAELP